MSLEGALDLDNIHKDINKPHQSSVVASFQPSLYRQPSLNEKDLFPERYRNIPTHTSAETLTSDLEAEGEELERSERTFMSFLKHAERDVLTFTTLLFLVPLR